MGRQTSFSVLPEGRYKASLDEVSIDEGEHPGVNIRFEIVSGKKKRSVWLRLGPQSRPPVLLDVRHLTTPDRIQTQVTGVAMGTFVAPILQSKAETCPVAAQKVAVRFGGKR